MPTYLKLKTYLKSVRSMINLKFSRLSSNLVHKVSLITNFLVDVLIANDLAK